VGTRYGSRTALKSGARANTAVAVSDGSCRVACGKSSAGITKRPSPADAALRRGERPLGKGLFLLIEKMPVMEAKRASGMAWRRMGCMSWVLGAGSRSCSISGMVLRRLRRRRAMRVGRVEDVDVIAA